MDSEKKDQEHGPLLWVNYLPRWTKVNVQLQYTWTSKNTFDAFDHRILLQKIQNATLGKKTCILMTKYLTNREQYTQINDSTLRTAKTRVPQSSTVASFCF